MSAYFPSPAAGLCVLPWRGDAGGRIRRVKRVSQTAGARRARSQTVEDDAVAVLGVGGWGAGVRGAVAVRDVPLVAGRAATHSTLAPTLLVEPAHE